MGRLPPAHGARRPVRSMADMLAPGADRCERFGGSRLLQVALRMVMSAVLSAAAFVLAMLLLVSTLR